MRKEYGRLKILKEISPPQEIKYSDQIGKWFLCECKCGNQLPVPKASLVSGNTTSCGCLRREKAKKQIEVNRELMIKNGNTTKPITKERVIEFNGMSKNITEWADHVGISKQAMQRRINNNWPLEKALTVKGDFENENSETTKRD